MAVALFFDVHVDHAILAQLRLRQVDVLTAQEEGIDQLTDDLLLEHTAGSSGCPQPVRAGSIPLASIILMADFV